jgi:hypothetical protein
MIKKFAVLPTALGLFLMLGMTGSLLAQPSNGSIHGTVVDATGALIPHARVTVTSAAGMTRTMASDDEGVFEVAELASGSYSVSVEAAGFTPAMDGVTVVGDTVTRESVKLGISVSQDVEVFADR